MISPLASLRHRNHTAILRAFGHVSQAHVAECLGVSEATVSRMKDGELEKFAGLLAACNLVVVPQSFKTIDPERLRALEVLARHSLDHDLFDPAKVDA